MWGIRPRFGGTSNFWSLGRWMECSKEYFIFADTNPVKDHAALWHVYGVLGGLVPVVYWNIPCQTVIGWTVWTFDRSLLPGARSACYAHCQVLIWGHPAMSWVVQLGHTRRKILNVAVPPPNSFLMVHLPGQPWPNELEIQITYCKLFIKRPWRV